MADTGAHIEIGSEVDCLDGVCGLLVSVAIRQLTALLTHLVVRPGHQHGVDRLVPAGMIDSIAATIGLGCSASQFEHLPFADEGGTLPGAAASWSFGPGQMSSFPLFERDMGTLEARPGTGAGGDPRVLLPGGELPGELQLRRGQPVDAKDGHIGGIRGLIVHPGTQRVTHIVLDEGHLFGKKEVAIPFFAVVQADDRVRLDLSKQLIHELPALA
jgi:hypothetical protein